MTRTFNVEMLPEAGPPVYYVDPKLPNSVPELRFGVNIIHPFDYCKPVMSMDVSTDSNGNPYRNGKEQLKESMLVYEVASRLVRPFVPGNHNPFDTETGVEMSATEFRIHGHKIRPFLENRLSAVIGTGVREYLYMNQNLRLGIVANSPSLRMEDGYENARMALVRGGVPEQGLRSADVDIKGFDLLLNKVLVPRASAVLHSMQDMHLTPELSNSILPLSAALHSQLVLNVVRFYPLFIENVAY